jgi:uncharacterized membrane protein
VGPEDLELLPLRHHAYATSVTADGQTIIGYQVSNVEPLEIGFRVTPELGMVPFTLGTPKAISADGRIVVGYVLTPDQLEAALFTSLGDTTMLGALPEFGSSYAQATSADGSVVVGVAYSGENNVGFRWTLQTGMVALDSLPGDTWAQAQGVSADGQLIVGRGSVIPNQFRTQGHAVLWDDAHGARRLDAVLAELGVDTGGVSLVELVGVSADGKVVVGNGIDASLRKVAFVARLP